jgi:hypothetical protein
MRKLAHRVISAEHRPDDSSDTEARAALRVCEKMRESLSVLVGSHGFRALLTRALTLAKAEAAWVEKLEVTAGGSLVFPGELEYELGAKEMAKGATALVTQMLELLGTFIGETLTHRLVQQIWPQVAPGDSKSGGKT